MEHCDIVEFDHTEEKVNKLIDYMVKAMSYHNHYLINTIISVLAKMTLDDLCYQYLDRIHFFSTIVNYVNEFAFKPVHGTIQLYNRQFANIVYYSLAYIIQHFQDSCRSKSSGRV